MFHLGYIGSGLFKPNWELNFGIFKTSIPMIFSWNQETIFRLVFNMVSPIYAFLSWYSVGR